MLLLLSKVIENAVYLQILHEYLDNNSLTYEYQSNFIENFSTDQSLVQLTDIIKRGIDVEMPTTMILVDLQKLLKS